MLVCVFDEFEETDENVKVEFWDVVDKGIQPQSVRRRARITLGGRCPDLLLLEVFAGVTSGSGDVNEKEIQNVWHQLVLAVSL
eukprot:196424-Hanusia_phi.AAC.1